MDNEAKLGITVISTYHCGVCVPGNTLLVIGVEKVDTAGVKYCRCTQLPGTHIGSELRELLIEGVWIERDQLSIICRFTPGQIDI